MTPPELETPRLVLRGFQLSDFEAYAALWADPDVVAFIGAPQSEEDAWLRFHTNGGYWSFHGLGFWTVVERETGQPIGQVGFMRNRRAMWPDISCYIEAGWAMLPAAQGRGYASEALTTALDWADAAFNDPEIACIIHPENAPSLRLAERSGFREIARADYHDDPVIVMIRKVEP